MYRLIKQRKKKKNLIILLRYRLLYCVENHYIRVIRISLHTINNYTSNFKKYMIDYLYKCKYFKIFFFYKFVIIFYISQKISRNNTKNLCNDQYLLLKNSIKTFLNYFINVNRYKYKQIYESHIYDDFFFSSVHYYTSYNFIFSDKSVFKKNFFLQKCFLVEHYLKVFYILFNVRSIIRMYIYK